MINLIRFFGMFIVSMPHAALWVVQPRPTIMTSWSVGVSMPHAALWVVQHTNAARAAARDWFQCRTRRCGWCNAKVRELLAGNIFVSMPHAALWVVQLLCVRNDAGWAGAFQCRTRLCGWCNIKVEWTGVYPCLCFNAARGFVGGATGLITIRQTKESSFQCRTRLCGWCNTISPSRSRSTKSFNAARGFVGGATNVFRWD